MTIDYLLLLPPKDSGSAILIHPMVGKDSIISKVHMAIHIGLGRYFHKLAEITSILSVFYVYFLLVCVDAELHRRAAGLMRAYIRRGAAVVVVEIRDHHARVIPGA